MHATPYLCLAKTVFPRPSIRVTNTSVPEPSLLIKRSCNPPQYPRSLSRGGGSASIHGLLFTGSYSRLKAALIEPPILYARALFENAAAHLPESESFDGGDPLVQ
eukprot:scaffold25033_cov67-Isochrysis_galbana.AAC.1